MVDGVIGIIIGPCIKTCGGGTRNGTSCESKGYLVHPGKCK